MLGVVGATKTARAVGFPLELWGGAECTVNRVGDGFRDQLEETGHAGRTGDFALLGTLGLNALRFPILWERVSPTPGASPDWQWSDAGLAALDRHGIRPIVGLIHHGSGPRHTSLIDPGFARGVADHAARVAARYPWIGEWNPVNEPLTTARFSALYGLWYPHARDERVFWLALLNQVDATRLAMREIRAVRSDARLIQTEDFGRTYATPLAGEQAAFDNQRRWMSWDLLCGNVDRHHPLWARLSKFGLQDRLAAIADDPCPPDVIGINHYLTSDRLLDERLERYPPTARGGNGRIAYADVEAVRVLDPPPQGLRGAIDEAWQRYRLPIAVTEVHNGCTREEQLRWFNEAWAIALDARDRGADVRAVTVWALFGNRGWDTLLTERGSYEAGAFDVSSGAPRETALACAIRSRGSTQPAASGAGWWRRDIRLAYPATRRPAPLRDCLEKNDHRADAPPILITGASGTLGQALARECVHRGLAHVLTERNELDLCDPQSIEHAIERHRPWAVINAAGWVRVDDAEHEREACEAVNAAGAIALADACARVGIASVYFSSDLVFGTSSEAPHCEAARPDPLNAYGLSKVKMEEGIAAIGGSALIIRTAAFFSPHDRHNFAMHCISALRRGEFFSAVADCAVCPTYVPDLCRHTIDLAIDGETGIWHLTNDTPVTWFDFARQLAAAARVDPCRLVPIPGALAGWTAARPANSALTSRRGALMPSLNSAIARFAEQRREDFPGGRTAAIMAMS